MRLENRRESSNVQDRRGIRYGKAGGIGIGTIVLALIAVYFGQDPSVVLQGVQQGPVQQEQVPYQESAEEAEARVLVSKVLADTEDAWGEIFRANGRVYEEPQLILNHLYKLTQMQESFGMILLAIAGGQPREMGLVQLLQRCI